MRAVMVVVGARSLPVPGPDKEAAGQAHALDSRTNAHNAHPHGGRHCRRRGRGGWQVTLPPPSPSSASQLPVGMKAPLHLECGDPVQRFRFLVLLSMLRLPCGQSALLWSDWWARVLWCCREKQFAESEKRRTNAASGGGASACANETGRA